MYVCDVLDVLICSAGVSRPGRLEDIPLDMYERMMRVNYLGSLYAAMAVTPFMKSKQQDGGRIMFVSSLAGLAGTHITSHHITSHHITYVHICMYVRTYACMYVCMYVCMYACMYICTSVTPALCVCIQRHILYD